MSKGEKDQDKESQSKLRLDEVWPQERDVMERPDRIRYVRKLVKEEGCVFCIANKQGPSLESLCVYKNEHAMVILNKYPYNSGHLLVLPTRHTGNITELSEEEYGAVSSLLLKTIGVVQRSYEAPGLNVGMNHGKAAGAGLPDHLHWHVIPRWQGDTNFFPLIAETKVVPESLEQVYRRMAKEFSKEDGA